MATYDITVPDVDLLPTAESVAVVRIRTETIPSVILTPSAPTVTVDFEFKLLVIYDTIWKPTVSGAAVTKVYALTIPSNIVVPEKQTVTAVRVKPVLIDSQIVAPTVASIAVSMGSRDIVIPSVSIGITAQSDYSVGMRKTLVFDSHIIYPIADSCKITDTGLGVIINPSYTINVIPLTYSITEY